MVNGRGRGAVLGLAGLAAVVGACGELEPDLRHVPLPSLQGANTVVLGIHTTRAFELHALPRNGTSVLELDEADVLTGEPFLAIGVSRSLPELGLAPGRLPPSGSLGLELFRAPSGVATWRDETRGWQLGGSELISEELREYRLPISQCASFRSELLYEGPGNARFMVPLEDDRALVGFERTTLMVTATTALQLTGANLGNALAPRSAVRVGDEVWMTDAFGKVFRSPARWPLDFRLVSMEPKGFLVGRGGGSSEDDLFLVGRPATLTSTLGVHRRQRGAWGQIGYIQGFDGSPVPGGPGEAFLPADVPGNVYRFTADGVALESTDDFSIESLASVPGYGVLGGTVDGFVVRREGGGRWTALPGRDFGWWVSDLTSYGRGFVALLASGTIVQYLGDTPCADLSYRSLLEHGRLLALGEGLLVAGSLSFEATLLYLRP